MFSDMVGYTALMQEDEAKARAQRGRCREILRRYVGQHGGQILQFYGDGALSSFRSAIEATKCAIEIQRALREEPKVPIRIGIHVGDVIFEEEGIVGDGVNVASRIESVAVPGGICMSEKVYDEIKNQSGMETKSLGRVELKNVRRPIEIFALIGEGFAVPEEILGAEKIDTQTQTRLGTSTTKQLPTKKGIPEKTIAVLPFVNMSADPENEYFSDGLTEQLITALSKVESLRVASRTSAFAFRGKQVDIRLIGEQLNVRTVLEGSVRKAGAKLRITAQLIDIADGYHLWSEIYDRTMEDVFAIQDEISRAIVDTLKIKLVEEQYQQPVKCYTCDTEVYNLYLKGRYSWNKWTEEGVKKGIDYFQQAIEKDPACALAYVGLADSFTLLGYYNFVPPKEAFPRAEAAASKALELDDKLAEAHASLALVRFFYDWDWSAAEREFKRAIELNPGYAVAHQAYAVYLTAMGHLDEGITEMKRAQELDPLSTPISAFVGWAFYFARQYDQVIEQCRKSLEMEPNFPTTHFCLGSAYLQKSMFDEAIIEFEKAITLSGGTMEERSVLGFAFAVSGRKDEAVKVLDELKQRSGAEYVPSNRLATIYTGLAWKEQAFESLQKACEERSGELVFLKVEPCWDSLRSDARFAALLMKVGLE